MNADKILFRASQMSEIMSGVDTGKSVDNSLTCKKRLIKIYDELVYGRKEMSDNKFCQKGTAHERIGIRLASVVRKFKFEKNETRFENEWFTTIPDSILPNKSADFKCSWSLKTFHEAIYAENAKKAYFDQAQVQMSVMNKPLHHLIYCLVNTPASLILREINALKYSFEEGAIGWLEAARQIEINHIFNISDFQQECHRSQVDYSHIIPVEEWNFDIPKEDRVRYFEIERNELAITKMKSQVTECREWMNENLFKK